MFSLENVRQCWKAPIITHSGRTRLSEGQDRKKTPASKHSILLYDFIWIRHYFYYYYVISRPNLWNLLRSLLMVLLSGFETNSFASQYFQFSVAQSVALSPTLWNKVQNALSAYSGRTYGFNWQMAQQVAWAQLAPPDWTFTWTLTTRLQANADMQTCANTLPNHAFFRLGCNIFSTDRGLWQTLDGELMMFDVWYCNLTWTFSTFANDLIHKHRHRNLPL